jgi:hypothetical protein
LVPIRNSLPCRGLSEQTIRTQEEPMRFLLPGMVAATMLIAISAIGSKAEAAMMPSVGSSLPAQTKNYTPVEKVYWRRGYYGYGHPYYGYGYRPYYGYGYGYRPYGYYGYGWRPGISIGVGPRWGWGY